MNTKASLQTDVFFLGLFLVGWLFYDQFQTQYRENGMSKKKRILFPR